MQGGSNFCFILQHIYEITLTNFKNMVFQDGMDFDFLDFDVGSSGIPSGRNSFGQDGSFDQVHHNMGYCLWILPSTSKYLQKKGQTTWLSRRIDISTPKC